MFKRSQVFHENKWSSIAFKPRLYLEDRVKIISKYLRIPSTTSRNTSFALRAAIGPSFLFSVEMVRERAWGKTRLVTVFKCQIGTWDTEESLLFWLHLFFKIKTNQGWLWEKAILPQQKVRTATEVIKSRFVDVKVSPLLSYDILHIQKILH